MKILVACEFSGIVRNAFVAKGHDAWSCDLLEEEQPRQDGWNGHYKGDIKDCLIDMPDWDLMIAHPPCTHLCSSGARWFKNKQVEQEEAVEFVKWLMNRPINKIALENPIGVLSTKYRKPDQIVQPWWFGHGETKATCLWLKNLPLLKWTNLVSGREPRVHYASPGPNRWKERSRTLVGFASAMAEQWGQK